MRTSLIFLTLVGFCACSTPWQPNQQYDYSYVANTLTGYGLGKDQYVGIITKGKLILQPESETVVRGKLSQVRHAHFHDELKDGLNSKIPEQKLSYSDEPQTESLFSINYKNGVIRSLDVDQSMSNDDVNQLKAVLSQMQVDTTGENVITCRHNQLPSDSSTSATNAFYKTMEPTVTGECETLYEMSAVPAFSDAEPAEKWAPQTGLSMDENLLQFVKTVNYSNCDVRRGYHFGISGASDMKPNSNQMGEFLSKASVTRVVVSGPLDRFTIRSVETTNRVAVSPMLYDDDQAEVVSRIALELESIAAINSPLAVNSESLIHVGNLVYRYNIPSDNQNNPRTSAKSAINGQYDEEQYNGQRQRRSIDSENHIRKQTTSSSSSSSSSESSEELNSPHYAAKYPHHYQPHPTTKQATEQPLHPFSIGNKGRSIQFHNSVDAVAEGQKLAEEISTDLESQGEIATRDTLEKYTILAELIQTMDYEQIDQLLASRKQQQQQQAGKQFLEETLLDAVAQAGTNPAVLWIVNNVSNGQVRGIQAASLLETAFKNLRTPTEPIVREIFEKIIKNDQVRKQAGPGQYPSILINFADLLRRAYSDKSYANNYYPVQSFGSFEKALGEIVTKEIVPWLGQRLADNINNKNQQRSQKYIRALGNVAHPKIVEVFETYLEDEKRASSFERLAIVAAFDKLAQSYPKYAQKVLYKIYSNVADEPEIRSMAVALLMRTDPPAAILQRMAMSTYNEPSIGVRTTIKSAINSAAQLTSSENANLAANAKAAQQFLNPHTYGLQNSKSSLRDHVSEVLQISEEFQMTHIMGPDSTFPKLMSYTSWKNYGGINMNDIDVQALMSSVQNVWDALVSDGKSNTAESQKSTYSAHKIIKQLGINFGSENNNEVAGQLLFKMLGRKNFVSFDEKTLKSAPVQLAGIIQKIMSGHQLHFNKIYDHQQIEVAFPLATGYPFYYSFKAPILVQTVGDVKAKTTPSLANAQAWSNIHDTQAINVTSKVRFTFSMEKIGKAGFITPFERQRYVAGQIQKMQVHMPMSANLNIDLKNNAVSGKVAPLATDNKVKLMHFSSWPFTARKNALSLRPVAEAQEVKLIEVRPTVGDETTFGQDSIGMAFHVRSQHQFSQNAVNAMERLLQNEGVKQYAQLPMSLILTMESLVKQQNIVNPVQFLPYLFEPTTQSTSSGNIVLSLLTMPFYQDMDNTGLTKLRAALSLASLPFADASELKETTQAEDISANGPWPKSGLAHYKFTLHLDLQRSANQAVKFGVQFDNQPEINESSNNKRSRSDKPLSSTDESKLALVSDIAPNSESRREEMIWNAARDMNQASAGLIDSALVFDGSKPAKFVGTIAQADNSVGDKTRVLLFGSAKTATGGPAKQVYASYIRNFANTPALNFYNAQKHNGKSNAKLTVILGEGGKPKNSKINVKIIMDQTNNYQQQLLQSPISQECERQMREEGNNQMPACLKATYQANLLDQFHIIAETEQPTSDVKSFAQSIYSVLNHWGYYNNKLDQSKKGQPGKLDAKINFDVRQHLMNMTIQLPTGQQNFTGLPIPRNARYLLAVHPGMNLEERTMRTMTRNSEVCVIDQTKILTFDNEIAEHQQIGKCWYAVLQHIKPTNTQDELSVLVRQANEGGNKRQVQIVTAGQRIQLSPSNTPNTPALVTVNDKPQQVSQKSSIDVHASMSHSRQNSQEKQLVARIYAISENDLKVELHGAEVKIYYDGERVRVHADPKLRNQVAGLCGNYDGEQNNDIATPEQKVLQNQEHYTPAWAVADETCESDVQQAQQRAQSARSYKVQYQAGNVVSNFENGKKFQGKRQSDSQWQSSSSSSSESNEHQHGKFASKAAQKQGNKPCEVTKRVQFLAQGPSYCFTTVEVNACPSHCAKKDQVTIEVPAHCRGKQDSVANMFVQQIRRGSNPDLSSKPVTQTIQINVPRDCANKQ
ncbi:vitellogenin-A1-like [Episyrphus balteatus]|uniref:vitellogenin-A1-like n=1 Tax=Episyrphus balteatus TaxID=286459 RepID=UPI002485DAD6|nr:vitellogenin-A1-like [Episyrphus balteatus]